MTALAGAIVFLGAASADEVDSAAEPCATGATLATGSPDPALVAREASRGVRAFWCETYDRDGTSRRDGAYREVGADGTIRARAHYVGSRLEGIVELFDEGGALWLRGELEAGDWTGTLTFFHANGEPALIAGFEGGRLDGAVETRFPDGRVESRTQYRAGREHGIASRYRPAAAGGGLQSQVRVEDDRIVEQRPTTLPAALAAELGASAMARVDASGPPPSASHAPRVDAPPGSPPPN